LNDKIKLSPGKKLIYNFILICIPFLILFLLEILLRIIGFGDNLNLFIDHPDKEFKEYKIVNPLIGKKYFQKLEYTSPPNDIFLKEKPDNEFRIFVIGSSTVIGFPYDYNLMFSRILQERLQDSYPEKNIEVVNISVTAINSYSLLDFMNDILKEKPDAILIYAGHNEFYGAFGIGSNEKTGKHRTLTFIHFDLMSSRIYQLLRNVIYSTRSLLSGENNESKIRGTLMKRIAGNKNIPYKEESYNIGIARYRKNMSEILKKARKNNIPVFISELICNIKDMEPFCSAVTTEYPAALDVYYNASKYEKEKNFKIAKENYYKAKDLDCIRFRASEEINDIIRNLSGKYNAILIPMQDRFENESPNGLIGNNLLTEHVHPNIDGYFLMADAFYNEIARSGLIDKHINILYYRTTEYYKRNWGYSVLDSLLALHRINSLKYHWPFRPFNSPYIDYRQIYKPKSMIDSLAFTAMKSPDFNIADAHLELAKYYREKDDFYYAFKEYNAAIKCFPYWYEDYLESADCLIKLNDFPTALAFLNKSLELKETFYGFFRKGEILLLKGDYEAALNSFAMASKFADTPNNKEKLLSKQFEAYYFNGDVEKSKVLLAKLKKLNPDYIPDLSPQKTNYVLLFPEQVKPLIISALNHYKAGKIDAALNTFLRSLEIKETPIANRISGEILLKRKNPNAIVYLLKAYPEFKNDENFLYNLCISYLQNGKPREAERIFNNIKRLNPNHESISHLEKLINTPDS
jgi:tetratricopeptide (TPR) repeat protein